MPSLMIIDQGESISIFFDEILKYHGRSSIAGAAHAFKAMERGFPLLSSGQPPDRHQIAVESGFPGGGARDAFEMVTRAVTEDRYRVVPELAGPEVPEAPGGHFFFRLGYRGAVVNLALRDGLVSEEFLELACREAPTAAEAERAKRLKEDMAEHLLSLPADEVYDAEVTSGPPTEDPNANGTFGAGGEHPDVMEDLSHELEQELAAAGVPRWAPRSAEDLGACRFYVWVDENRQLRSVLVGALARSDIDILGASCRQVLEGTGPHSADPEPADLHQPTALLVAHLYGVGHGPLSRAELRPLRDLLRSAMTELTNLRGAL